MMRIISIPYMSAIIERNTVLPCSRVQRYYTVSDYQSEVRLISGRGRNLMRRIICSWECSRYRFRKKEKRGKNVLISVLLMILMVFWKCGENSCFQRKEGFQKSCHRIWMKKVEKRMQQFEIENSSKGYDRKQVDEGTKLQVLLKNHFRRQGRILYLY